jgi:hypothetical protein
MGCAMALVALGIGYLVLLNANKEKESLKFLGQAIAVLIMLGAVVSVLCSTMKYSKSGQCAMSSKASMCPFTGKAMDQAQQ